MCTAYKQISLCPVVRTGIDNVIEVGEPNAPTAVGIVLALYEPCSRVRQNDTLPVLMAEEILTSVGPLATPIYTLAETEQDFPDQ
jgi:hypothetical protein